MRCLLLYAFLVGVVGCERKAAMTAGERDATPSPVDAGPVDATEITRVPAPPGPYTGPRCDESFAPKPERDASPLCFEPGGTYLMGSPEGEGDPDEHPQRRVTVSPFFIDQFEVTRVQFARFLNEADHSLACDEIGDPMCPTSPSKIHPRPPWALDLFEDGKIHDWKEGQFVVGAKWRFAARVGEERLPMNEITFRAAREYCAWVGKELPTHARWEYAARVEPLTGQVRRFVWGDTFVPRRTNCSRDACLDPYASVAPVDAMPGDVSATGVRGLAGNVSEWVIGCHTPTIENCGDCLDPIGETGCRRRGPGTHDEFGMWSIRGSAFNGPPDRVRGAERDGFDGPFLLIGFRCAVTAQPPLRAGG